MLVKAQTLIPLAALLLAPRDLRAQAEAADAGEHGHGHRHPHPHEPGEQHHHGHMHPHDARAGHHHPLPAAAVVVAPAVLAAPSASASGALVITGVTPAAGPPGAQVTITAPGLARGARVWMGGRALRTIAERPGAIVVEIPPRGWPPASSDVLILRQPKLGDVRSAAAFSVEQPPAITGFAPRSAAPGARVEIFGKNFRAGDEVLFASLALDILDVAPDRITVVAPLGPKKAVFVVRRGAATFAAREPFVAMAPPPEIVSFSPPSGPPGQSVRVSGRGFLSTDEARLAGHPQKVVARGPEFIEIEIGPFGKTGPIAIVGPGRFATSASDYRVMAGPSIDSFAPAFGAPGTRVVLRGRGFQPGDQVLLGEKVLDVAASSAEALTVVIPDDADAGSLSVRRGAARSSSAKAFEVVLPPIVAGFEPTGGPAETRVVLRGRHLAADARVLLGDRPAPILAREGAESAPAHATGCALTVAIPKGASSAPFTVITRAGQGISARAFSVLEYAKIASIAPTFGPVGTEVTLSGLHFTPEDRVLVGERAAEVVASSPAAITVRIPEGAKPAPIVVESHGRRVASRQIFRVIAKPPPPSLVFQPMSGPAGSEVVVAIGRPLGSEDELLLGGRPLAMKILPGRMRATVHLPDDATSGTFELVRAGGQERVRADRSFDVTGR
ncbi:MAG: IPT/TIG domain-containing protein [Myxococcota bacterium]